MQLNCSKNSTYGYDDAIYSSNDNNSNGNSNSKSSNKHNDDADDDDDNQRRRWQQRRWTVNRNKQICRNQHHYDYICAHLYVITFYSMPFAVNCFVRVVDIHDIYVTMTDCHSTPFDTIWAIILVLLPKLWLIRFWLKCSIARMICAYWSYTIFHCTIEQCICSIQHWYIPSDGLWCKWTLISIVSMLIDGLEKVYDMYLRILTYIYISHTWPLYEWPHPINGQKETDDRGKKVSRRKLHFNRIVMAHRQRQGGW